MICLNSTRFSMRAQILKPSDVYEDLANPDYGWENSQDPYTGEISETRKLKKDNPSTTTVDESTPYFPCLARGVISNGIRSVGNTEQFGEVYADLEYVQMWFPAYVSMTKGDRVTAILDSAGKPVFQDEQYRSTPTPTVFNVDGVTPILDPFNRHIENFALLSRAE